VANAVQEILPKAVALQAIAPGLCCSRHVWVLAGNFLIFGDKNLLFYKEIFKDRVSGERRCLQSRNRVSFLRITRAKDTEILGYVKAKGFPFAGGTAAVTPLTARACPPIWVVEAEERLCSSALPTAAPSLSPDADGS